MTFLSYIWWEILRTILLHFKDYMYLCFIQIWELGRLIEDAWKLVLFMDFALWHSERQQILLETDDFYLMLTRVMPLVSFYTSWKYWKTFRSRSTSYKMKLLLKSFFSKCEQICKFVKSANWICSRLRKKLLKEKITFWAVCSTQKYSKRQCRVKNNV